MDVVFLENSDLKIGVIPRAGGRISSFRDKHTNREYLWAAPEMLSRYDADGEYDPQFCGGIDELLPSDPAEEVAGCRYPDHGELWRTALEYECVSATEMELHGRLPLCRLTYRRRMILNGGKLACRVSIANPTGRPVPFLWKLHAALAVAPGDQVSVPAQCMTAADPAWSTLPDAMPRRFSGRYEIPPKNNGSEFLFLTELQRGEAELRYRNGGRFICRFDPAVFPNVWLFGSFGRLNESYTAILEPCTNYPLYIADAAKARCCAELLPGRELVTEIIWEVVAE